MKQLPTATCVVAAIILAAACTPPVETRARTLAERWLQAVDRGDFSNAWELTGLLVRSNIRRERWDGTVREARDHGAVVSRKFLDAEFTTEPLKMAPGAYVVVRYETKFESKDAIEIVIVSRGEKSSLGVAAYWVSTLAGNGV